MIHWLALNKIILGQTQNFIDFLKSNNPEQIFRMNLFDLMKNFQISDELAKKISDKELIKWAEKEIKICEKNNIKIVTFNDRNYPEYLKEIYNPPILLYLKGNLEKTLGRISIVGARRCTEYGERIAYEFAKEIVKYDIGVISGLAEGIDSYAHKGALDANGFTIGVLGCGIDIIYPQINKKLFSFLEKKGAIISEFPLGTAPLKGNFPIRNRIISGLAIGVLVIEAAEKSGSLITAKYALEQNRNVYAIPGNIFWNYSKGTNELIKKGAKLVDSAKEIILDMFPQFADTGALDESKLDRLKKISEEEEMVLDVMQNEPIEMDKILEKSKLEISKIYDIILNLQLEGYIQEVSGKRYIRR